ncbi:MAG TPA: L,D-transpeptidase [Actinomycetota bacterium]|nr:L,D-transpeptidase [Actinomycetota bacterium]
MAGPMRVTARPGGGRVIGTFPATSRYYQVPLVAWVIRTTDHGRFGLVTLPYSGTRQTGWIPLDGLPRSRTPIEVRVDLSRHELIALRLDRVILRAPAATGASDSPTPPGRYFVTDRVPFPAGGPYGTFAFGLSGIQTHLPPGWTGGDQLAIHGTNDPGSIGASASAGCIRVSEAVLARLRPLLRLGTPVVIRP